MRSYLGAVFVAIFSWIQILGSVHAELTFTLKRPQRQANEECRESVLHRAVHFGDVKGVEEYVKEGGDLYATDCQGMSAMHIAIKEGKEEMILSLLEKKFDLNRIFPKTGTILHFAISNRYDLVPKLIKLGCNINLKFEPNGETYLHQAALARNFRLMLRIIDLDPEIDAVDKNGNTALGIAVQNNEPAIANLLISAGANIRILTNNKQNLLHLAVKGNCTTCLRRFLDSGLFVDSKDSEGITPIMLAIERNETGTAIMLSEFGADLEQKYWANNGSLLHLAAEKACTACVKWLLQRGLPAGEKDREGNTPLSMAISSDDTASAELLLKAGADIRQRWGLSNSTLLHWAAEKGSVNSIKWLIQQGLVPEVTDKDKWIPLHYAANWGHLRAVKTLIDLGSCLNCKDVNGNTPLHYALGFPSIAEYLKDLGGRL